MKQLNIESIKIILFVLLSWFVFQQIFLKNDIREQWNYFLKHLEVSRIYLLVIAVLLMPLNWLIETVKWKVLLRTNTSFLNLLKSITAGITVGFVTPGRTGEFLGRVMFLNDGERTRAFYLSSIGGFAQTAASLLVGVPFVYLWHSDAFISGIVLGIACIYLIVYFRFDLFNKVISSSSILRYYGLTISEEELPPSETQLYVLLLSMLRFVVYLTQYILLLIFFGVGNDFLALGVHSVVFLLIQTISPLMPLLDVSFRSGSALFVFKTFTDNNLAVLSAVMLVWIVNLAFPAVLGYLFILKRKLF